MEKIIEFLEKNEILYTVYDHIITYEGFTKWHIIEKNKINSFVDALKEIETIKENISVKKTWRTPRLYVGNLSKLLNYIKFGK